MSTISFQYSPWLVVLCLLCGVAYALVLYYRDKQFSTHGVSVRFVYAMALARFVVVSILALLLLSPFIKSRNTQTFKPIVAIVNDNSESVKNGLKKDTALYREKLSELEEELSRNYEVVRYNAGDKLRTDKAVTFTDKTTNLSDAIEELNAIYYNRNLGAVIVASDGIYNKGNNPVYSLSNAGYQVYTIAVGDTSIQRDQKITNARFNKIVYLNDRFAVKAEVEATNLNGRNVKLTLQEIEAAGAKLLEEKALRYESDNVFSIHDFIVPADKPGIHHYRISLSATDGEVTYGNNQRDIFIEVLDGRQKILLLAAAPHPDVAALKAAIESNKNYQLETAYAESFTGSLREYSLIILHQLPAARHKVAQVLSEVNQLKKPVLFVTGLQTQVADFNKAQTAVTIRAGGERTNDVTAVSEKSFSLFTLSDKTMQAIGKLPPLVSFFGSFDASPTAKVMLQQRINSVQTDFPLWAFNENGEMKTGVICGEGLWRWRLYDYSLHKNHDATNELLNKTVQYLSVKTDKRPFRISTEKNMVEDNEAVLFDAQFYNANFEPVNTPDVAVTIKGEDGRQYDYTMNRTETAYQLNAGVFPAGNYTYTAKLNNGNAPLTATGKFTVSALQLEEIRTRADHRVLYQMATQHNGSMHYLSTAGKIAEEITAKNQLKPILYDTFTTQNAINLKWIFFLLICLLGAEWGIRKYWGGY